jgi:hypothetical protein
MSTNDDYAERIQREETERHAWAEAFAVALGAIVEEPTEHSRPCFYLKATLVESRSTELQRHKESRSHRRLAHDRPPRHMRPPPETQSINIGMAKKPHVAAADFMRRFWTAYKPEYLKQMERTRESNKENQEAKALALQLGDIIGDRSIHDRITNQETRERLTLYAKNGAQWELSRHGSIQLTLNVNDPAQALQLAQFIADNVTERE